MREARASSRVAPEVLPASESQFDTNGLVYTNISVGFLSGTSWTRKKEES